MKRLRYGLLLLLTSCALERSVPALVRPPNLDSLERVAQLPAYLVPPPAQATAKQADAWRNSQVQLLANVGAPVGKVKLKNVGNTDDHRQSTVQQGITGPQLTLVAVLLGVVGLVCWLKPWR